MALTCAVNKCSNGAYWLNKWKEQLCETCGCLHKESECRCDPPFRLYSFPSKHKNPERREEWKQLIGRQDGKKERPWSPSKDSRVCSVHFTEGEPTCQNPLPTLKLGHEEPEKRILKRKSRFQGLRPKRLKATMHLKVNTESEKSDAEEQGHREETEDRESKRFVDNSSIPCIKRLLKNRHEKEMRIQGKRRTYYKYCCICNNYRGKTVNGRCIVLHRFPANEKLRNAWIKQIQAFHPNFVLNLGNDRLCCAHFVGGVYTYNEIPSVFTVSTKDRKAQKQVVETVETSTVPASLVSSGTVGALRSLLTAHNQPSFKSAHTGIYHTRKEPVWYWTPVSYWIHTFCLLASSTQGTAPSTEQKQALLQAGLGERKITFVKDSSPESFKSKLEEVFPILKDCRGFELLRSNWSSRIVLDVLEMPATGFTSTYLADESRLGQAVCYIRPRQKDIPIDRDCVQKNDGAKEIPPEVYLDFDGVTVKTEVDIEDDDYATNYTESGVVIKTEDGVIIKTENDVNDYTEDGVTFKTDDGVIIKTENDINDNTEYGVTFETDDGVIIKTENDVDSDTEKVAFRTEDVAFKTLDDVTLKTVDDVTIKTEDDLLECYDGNADIHDVAANVDVEEEHSPVILGEVKTKNSSAPLVLVEMKTKETRTYSLLNKDLSTPVVFGSDIETPSVLDMLDKSKIPQVVVIPNKLGSRKSMSLLFHDYCSNTDSPVSRCVNEDMKAKHEKEYKCHRNTCTQTINEVGVHSSQTVDVQKMSMGTNTMEKPELTIEDIEKDKSSVMFYTGLSDAETFYALFDELKDIDGNNAGSESKISEPGEILRKVDEFLLVLMRIRLGLLAEDLAYRFHISKTICARIFEKWISHLSVKIDILMGWPESRFKNSGKSSYAKFRSDRNNTLSIQCMEFSNGRNFYKSLIGITSDWKIKFVSDLYQEAIGDKELTEACGVLDLLHSGDTLVAEKGFNITDLTAKRGIRLVLPSGKNSNKIEVSKDNSRQVTKEVKHLQMFTRIAAQRIEYFRILREMSFALPADSKIWKICAGLTNLQPPLAL